MLENYILTQYKPIRYQNDSESVHRFNSKGFGNAVSGPIYFHCNLGYVANVIIYNIWSLVAANQ